MKTQKHTLLESGRTWVSALVATLLTVTAFTASAKDEVPLKLKWTITAVTPLVTYEDGSYVETSVQVGNGTQLGNFTAVDTYGVESLDEDDFGLDPASGLPAIFLEFAGTTTKTGANGDTIVFDYVGCVIIPLDGSPWRLENEWTVTGGTGRFEGATGHGTSEGTVHEDGTSSGVSIGVISTVGSKKK